MQMNVLKSKLALCNKSIEELANDIGINKATFYRKMKGDSEFTRKEINDIATILNLDQDDIIMIFFNQEVS